jgi:hypothetical protein
MARARGFVKVLGLRIRDQLIVHANFSTGASGIRANSMTLAAHLGHHANRHELLRLREWTEADGGEIVGAGHGMTKGELRMTNERPDAAEKIQKVLESRRDRGFLSVEFAANG